MSRGLFVLLILISTTYSASLLAYGKGPIGLWPVSERYVLVADSSLPGLVLVDIASGNAVERLVIEGANPTCVSSCPDCDFVFMTGTGGDYWRLKFEAPLTQLIRDQGALGFNTAVLEPLALHKGEGAMTDGRRCLVSNDGLSAFVASFRDRAMFRIDLSATPTATRLLDTGEHKPFGLNWGRNGNLLLTMHKNEMWRINLKGELLARYNISDSACPGTERYQPNLRAAIDDPTNPDKLLILASNPGTYDALIWRLQTGSKTRGRCTIAAGSIGPGPGWRDGRGGEVRFSRPHYFSLRPDTETPQLIITDIDNHALRLLNLASGTTFSVMYDRDRATANLPEESKRSALSCKELEWKQGPEALDNVT
jgi:hypothetical protein